MATPRQDRIERRLAAILDAGMMRREFIALLGGMAVAWPHAAHAQQSDQMRRIGVLQVLADDDPETAARRAAFEHALQSLGWTVGRNVRIDYRSAKGDASHLRKYAAELVALGPDVMLAGGSITVAPVLLATRTIPIVFVQVVDPPTKYELIINLKTAKAIGLTVPPSLLVRADEVIDLHRHVGWLLALEEAIDIASRAAVIIDRVGSIGDQSAVE